MFEATRVARERALAGEGPTMIEAVTMRMHGHAAHDDMRYVPKALLEEWARRTRSSARNAGWPRRASMSRRSAEVRETVERATEEALAMPMPDGASATEGVFADEAIPLGDGDAPWSGHDAPAHANGSASGRRAA